MRSVDSQSHQGERPSPERAERGAATTTTGAGGEYSSPESGSAAYWKQMQSLVGNQAVQRMMSASSGSAAPIQRMKDEDGQQREMLMEMYRGIYETINKEAGGLKPLPKPSDRWIRRDVEFAVESATKLDEALDLLANQLAKKYFGAYDESYKQKMEQRIVEVGKSAQTSAMAYREEKKRDLDAMNEGLDPDARVEKKYGSKRTRREWEGTAEFYADPGNLKRITERLKDKKFRNKVMSSSIAAQRQLVTMARPTIAKRAQHNALQDESQPMGMADMLSAQRNYTKVKTGDALLLEKGGDYQVTMTRKGGQEIGQLGTYLTASGSKKSVKQTVRDMLGPGLTTQQLGRAIETRDPQRVGEQYGLKGKELRNARAMRHLHAVERDRGPEVAISTAMEQRMVSLGMSHMGDYLERHPLGPPDATSDLRKARDKAGEQPPSDYVPEYIQQRAFDGLGRLASEAFKKTPKEDPSLALLLRELANVREGSEADGEEEEADYLTEAMTLSMMSPPYVWPEDREHEQEDEYTKRFNQLANRFGGSGEPGTIGPGGLEASLQVPDGIVKEEREDERMEKGEGFLGGEKVGAKKLPVNGLPNRKNDCFVNAVVQLLAEPYADYFDVGKHALRDPVRQEAQRMVGEAMAIVGGRSEPESDKIGKLREKLLAANLVAGMDGQEDASELMLGLLRIVTDLEGARLELPVQPAQQAVVGKDETLRDVAERTGSDLGQLQSLNKLLDTSPITQVVQPTKKIAASTSVMAVPQDSAVYAGGESAGAPERGPGFETIDMDTFKSFGDYLRNTFGEGATRTTLSPGNEQYALSDGQPTKVSAYDEKRAMLRAPDVLTFSLKRFKRTLFATTKNNADFPMPRSFKLIEHSGGAGKEKTYGLVGSVLHEGGTGGGHYTADVSRAGKWYHANDSKVTEHDEAEDATLAQSYIYTYKVTDVQDL